MHEPIYLDNKWNIFYKDFQFSLQIRIGFRNMYTISLVSHKGRRTTRARRVSMTRVQILLNHVDPQSRFFEDQGYALAPTHYTMVSRTYAPTIVTPDSLARDWSFTLGDFDVA